MREKEVAQRNFGWTYFHFVDPSGLRVNVINHQTDIFGLGKEPYMTMIVKELNSNPLRFKEAPNFTWIKDSEKMSGEFNFIFDNVKFGGTVSRICESGELSDIVLYRNELGQQSHWAVDMPYGEVTGILSTPQGEKPLTGYMYQDRQWGDILIQEWVKNWTWTHLAGENLFVVAFCINSVDKQKSWHSIFGCGREVSIGNNLEVPHLLKIIRSQHPDSDVFQGEIEIPGKLSVLFPLQPENIMRSRIKENHSDFLASYIRWSVNGAVKCSGKPVCGIAEYIEINKL